MAPHTHTTFVRLATRSHGGYRVVLLSLFLAYYRSLSFRSLFVYSYFKPSRLNHSPLSLVYLYLLICNLLPSGNLKHTEIASSTQPIYPSLQADFANLGAMDELTEKRLQDIQMVSDSTRAIQNEINNIN